MSQDDYAGDLYDDDDMLELNEKLPNTGAPAAQAMDGYFDEEEHISPLMFGPAGRGASPEVGLIPEQRLYKGAAEARRKEGFKDDRYLENPKLEPFSDQQKKEAEDEKRLDEMLDNMYREMKKPVARSKAKSPSSKKGGKRKRSSTRSRVSRKRSSRRSRRNKRSRSRKSKRSRR